jgi:hypothetical protein
MNIKGMGFNSRYGRVRVMSQLFVSELVLGVGVNVEASILQKMGVQSSDIYLSVNAFGNASHLWMTVPVKLQSVWH